jgi:hypothetical protein
MSAHPAESRMEDPDIERARDGIGIGENKVFGYVPLAETLALQR